MDTLRIDSEFKGIIPPLSEDERSQLEANLLQDGCRVPITVWDGVIVDGHNRYEICTVHGLDFKLEETEFESREKAKIWIINNQLGRRNLQAYVRGELELLKGEYEKAKRGPKEFSVKSQKIDRIKTLSDKTGTGYQTASRIIKIHEHADEPQKVKLRSGESSINEVYKEIKTKENRAQRVMDIKQEAKPVGSLDKKFSVLYADPPWKYDFSKASNRDIENQYPTMELEEILELPIQDISTQSAILFLWATSPKLLEALRVMDAWGFEYKTCAIWDKEKIGMGYYFRQQHELLLVGTKGNMPPPEPSDRVSSIFKSPRGKHSKKPEIVYSYIESMYPDFDKVELFARSSRIGWESWGNEV